MITGFKLNLKKQILFVPKLAAFSKHEFRQQFWGLGIFPYRYLAVLKISRKSGADSCSIPLISWSKLTELKRNQLRFNKS